MKIAIKDEDQYVSNHFLFIDYLKIYGKDKDIIDNLMIEPQDSLKQHELR